MNGSASRYISQDMSSLHRFGSSTLEACTRAAENMAHILRPFGILCRKRNLAHVGVTLRGDLSSSSHMSF